MTSTNAWSAYQQADRLHCFLAAIIVLLVGTHIWMLVLGYHCKRCRGRGGVVAEAQSTPYRKPYHYHLFITMIGVLLVGITIASFVFADGWGQVWNSLAGVDHGLSRTMLNYNWPANWDQQEISRHINRMDSSLVGSVAYDY